MWELAEESEFGVEMQSHEVSGGNADSPEASNTGSLVQSTPAQGNIVNSHAEDSWTLWQAQGALQRLHRFRHRIPGPAWGS